MLKSIQIRRKKPNAVIFLLSVYLFWSNGQFKSFQHFHPFFTEICMGARRQEIFFSLHITQIHWIQQWQSLHFCREVITALGYGHTKQCGWLRLSALVQSWSSRLAVPLSFNDNLSILFSFLFFFILVCKHYCDNNQKNITENIPHIIERQRHCWTRWPALDKGRETQPATLLSMSRYPML